MPGKENCIAFIKAWMNATVLQHRANEEICPPLRGQIPAAVIRKLSGEALSRAFIESGPLQIFISCTIFRNWSLMSTVDITVIYCLSRVTNFTAALQIMNVEGLIIFIHPLNKGNMMCHMGKRSFVLTVFIFGGVMITLPHTCSANKLPAVVWYCWRWTQSNIFPGISVGPTSVCPTHSFPIMLLLQKHHFHTRISPDKWIPCSLVSTLSFFIIKYTIYVCG